MTLVPLTADSVSLSLQALLTTHDLNARNEANQWLVDIFRPSYEAWDVSLHLLGSRDRSSSNDIQIFAAQTLFSKLSDQIDQIFNDPNRCREISRFLTSQCLLPLESTQFSKPVRLRLSECLGVAIVSLIGAHWPTALIDILNSVQRDTTTHPSSVSIGYLTAASNLLHTIGSLPDLVTTFEYKKVLMCLLGHRTYTPWRKTTAAKKLKAESELISSSIATLLDVALNILQQYQQQQHQTGTLVQNRTLALEIIHEALVATTNWSKAFDSPLVMASDRFRNPHLIWKLLVIYGDVGDPSLPEIFGATVPSLHLSNPSSNGNICSTIDPFALESLGNAKGVVEPLLAYFCQKLLSSLSIICQAGSPPPLERIDAFGGREFLMFIYHWTTIVYDISVMTPTLLLHQPLPILTLSQVSEAVTLPPHFLFQLLKLASLLHPLTHSRVLEMWSDVIDLKNDRLLSTVDVTCLLNELSEVTLKCLFAHLRRDCPAWDPESSSECADPSGKIGYIETAQDAIVHLYYLYEGADADLSAALLEQITKMFLSCCSNSDSIGAASCLILLESIIETVVDLSAPHFTENLVTVCEKVPIDDTECVEIVANLIKKQSVFLTKDNHVVLWTSMFECLMRIFKASPKLCAEGILDLCDSGGTLGLRQVGQPTDLIRNFYLFIDSTSKAIPEAAIDFEPALYGALSALIRQMRTEDAPQVFADSLTATVTSLESLLPAFSEYLQNLNVSESEPSLPSIVVDCVRLLLRLSRAISSLESKQAEISDITMIDIRQKFIATFLFGHDGLLEPKSQTWKTCCTAASALLSIHLVERQSGTDIPASDCYEKRKLENKIWAWTPSRKALKNLGLHFTRQSIKSIPIFSYTYFWESISKLILHHLQASSPRDIDLSICYAISDLLRSINHYRCERSGDSPNGRPFPTELPIVQHLSSTVASCLVRNAAMKAERFPVATWGTNMKPFFDVARQLVLFWDALKVNDDQTLSLLAQLLVKALECPSKKIQKNVFTTLSKLLSCKTSALPSSMISLYPEIVKSFWCHCHLWGLQNMTAIVTLMESLIHPMNSLNEMEFINQSQKVIASTTGNVDGLMGILSESDTNFILLLLRHLRGMRLRQLLMDLVKIGKRLQTSDCLLSYEFILSDLPLKQPPKVTVQLIDLD